MGSKSDLKEARRAPGSEWLKNHPRMLEIVYNVTKNTLAGLYPLMNRVAPGITRRIMIWSEEVLKGWAFNCQMCGQCILHSTGMTCPMNCPKNLRNGPCGGVRPNGNCEVIPDLPCVWVQAWERSQHMQHFAGEMQTLQPPLNRELQNTSAWINLFETNEVDGPAAWRAAQEVAEET